jgi:hypothetical protein
VEPRISGKDATQVADDMAKRGPIRLLARSELQEVAGAPAPSAASEQGRKAPPRVRKPLARNDQCFAPFNDGRRARSAAPDGVLGGGVCVGAIGVPPPTPLPSEPVKAGGHRPSPQPRSRVA